MMRLAWVLAAGGCALGGLLVSGCETGGRPGGRDMPPPPYDEVADRFNENARRLDSLWARITISVRSPTERGGRRFDQAEGHIQLVQPDKVALTINKLGETLYYLGSNEAFYWWIDLTGRGDEKYALVGRHGSATPERAREFGVPVHPLELMDLAAITPLPETPSERIGPVSAPGRTSWSGDGKLIVVELPGRWGVRKLWIDPQRFEPQQVDMLGPEGELAIRSELSWHDYVPVRGEGGVGPRMPTSVRLTIPEPSPEAGDGGESETVVTMRLWDPQVRPVQPRAFELAALLKGYRVEQTFDLDAPRNTPPDDEREQE